MTGIEDLFGNINLETPIDVEEVNAENTPGGEDKGVKGDNKNNDQANPLDVDLGGLGLEQELIEVPEFENTEEEDKSGKQDKNTTPGQKDIKDSTSSSPDFKPFADFTKGLFEKGVISQFDEEEFGSLIEQNGGDPVEAIYEYMDRTVKDAHNEWLETYPKPIQDIIKSYEEGIPLEKMLDVKREQVQLDTISEDKLEGENAVELRKQILTEHYKTTTKFSPEKIKKLVETSINLGEDESDAKEALKELKTIRKEEEKKLKDEAIKQQENLRKQQAERLEVIKKDIYATKEIIPSIQLTKKEQDDLYKSMTTVVTTTPEGKGLTEVDLMFAKNPIEMRKALHYYAQKGLFKVDDKTGTWNPDFSKITNSLKSQVTKEVKNNAANSRTFKSGVSVTSDDEGSNRGELGKSFTSYLNSRK